MELSSTCSEGSAASALSGVEPLRCSSQESSSHPSPTHELCSTNDSNIVLIVDQTQASKPTYSVDNSSYSSHVNPTGEEQMDARMRPKGARVQLFKSGNGAEHGNLVPPNRDMTDTRDQGGFGPGLAEAYDAEAAQHDMEQQDEEQSLHGGWESAESIGFEEDEDEAMEPPNFLLRPVVHDESELSPGSSDEHLEQDLGYSDNTEADQYVMNTEADQSQIGVSLPEPERQSEPRPRAVGQTTQEGEFRVSNDDDDDDLSQSDMPEDSLNFGTRQIEGEDEEMGASGGSYPPMVFSQNVSDFSSLALFTGPDQQRHDLVDMPRRVPPSGAADLSQLHFVPASSSAFRPIPIEPRDATSSRQNTRSRTQPGGPTTNEASGDRNMPTGAQVSSHFIPTATRTISLKNENQSAKTNAASKKTMESLPSGDQLPNLQHQEQQIVNVSQNALSLPYPFDKSHITSDSPPLLQHPKPILVVTSQNPGHVHLNTTGKQSTSTHKAPKQNKPSANKPTVSQVASQHHPVTKKIPSTQLPHKQNSRENANELSSKKRKSNPSQCQRTNNNSHHQTQVKTQAGPKTQRASQPNAVPKTAAQTSAQQRGQVVQRGTKPVVKNNSQNVIPSAPQSNLQNQQVSELISLNDSQGFSLNDSLSTSQYGAHDTSSQPTSQLTNQANLQVGSKRTLPDNKTNLLLGTKPKSLSGSQQIKQHNTQAMSQHGSNTQPISQQGYQLQAMTQETSQPMTQYGYQMKPISQQAYPQTSQLGSQPMSQPMSQVASQPMSQPTSQVASQPMSQPTSQVASQPMSQPMSQVASQPMSQPMSQVASQPMPNQGSQPMPNQGSQPMSQLGYQPMSQLGSQPILQQGTQPMWQQGSQPMSQQGSQSQAMSQFGFQPQPMSQYGNQPMSQIGTQPQQMSPAGTQSMSHPASQPMSQQGLQPMSQQGSQPQPMSQPMSQQGSQPQPMSQPMSQQGSQPQPMPQPMSQQGSQPMSQNGAQLKPNSQYTTQPIPQHSSQPVAQHSTQPIAQHGAQPFYQPAQVSMNTVGGLNNQTFDESLVLSPMSGTASQHYRQLASPAPLTECDTLHDLSVASTLDQTNAGVDIQNMEQVRSQLQEMLCLTNQRLPDKGQYDETVRQSGELTDTLFSGTEAPSHLGEMISFTSQQLDGPPHPPAVSRQQPLDAAGLMADNHSLVKNLERETFRRKHCEKQIQDLQNKLLELQQQLAVAVSTDRKKDVMIEHLDKNLARVVDGWKRRDKEREECITVLTTDRDRLGQKQTEQAETISKLEDDLSLTVSSLQSVQDEAADTDARLRQQIADVEGERNSLQAALSVHQTRLRKMEEESSLMKGRNQQLTQQMTELQEQYDLDHETWEEKERDYLQKVDDITKNHFDQMAKYKSRHEQLTVSHEETSQALTEAQLKLQSQELALDEAHREVESLKVEIGIVEARGESALRTLESDLQAEAESKMLDALEELRNKNALSDEQTRERHRRQIQELNQHHAQEMQQQLTRLHDDMRRQEDQLRRETQEYQDRIELLQEDLQSARSHNETLEGQREEITKKLQEMMQAHCNETLRLLKLGSQASTLAALKDPQLHMSVPPTHSEFTGSWSHSLPAAHESSLVHAGQMPRDQPTNVQGSLGESLLPSGLSMSHAPPSSSYASLTPSYAPPTSSYAPTMSYDTPITSLPTNFPSSHPLDLPTIPSVLPPAPHRSVPPPNSSSSPNNQSKPRLNTTVDNIMLHAPSDLSFIEEAGGQNHSALSESGHEHTVVERVCPGDMFTLNTLNMPDSLGVEREHTVYERTPPMSSVYMTGVTEGLHTPVTSPQLPERLLGGVEQRFDEHEQRQYELQHYIKMLLEKSRTDTEEQTPPAPPHTTHDEPPSSLRERHVAFSKTTVLGPSSSHSERSPPAVTAMLSPEQTTEISRLLGMYRGGGGSSRDNSEEADLYSYLQSLQTRNEEIRSNNSNQSTPTRDEHGRHAPPSPPRSRSQKGQGRVRCTDGPTLQTIRIPTGESVPTTTPRSGPKQSNLNSNKTNKPTTSKPGAAPKRTEKKMPPSSGNESKPVGKGVPAWK